MPRRMKWSPGRPPKVKPPKVNKAKPGPRPKVSVKVKPANKTGICLHCHQRWMAGDRVAYVRTTERRYHEHCVPTMATLEAALRAQPAAPIQPLTALDASMAALVHLETALVMKAKDVGVTDEMEKAFSRYQKAKALALRATTDGEERAAIRRAVLDAVNLVF